MNTQTYKISGMHCASCASIIQKTVEKVDGVESIDVNPVTETAKIVFDEKKTNLKNLSQRIEPLGYSFIIDSEIGDDSPEIDHDHGAMMTRSKVEKLSQIKKMKFRLFTALPIAAFSIFVMSWHILSEIGLASEMSGDLSNISSNLLPLMATYILFFVGRPYIVGFYRFIRHGKANMDSLIGMGTSVAYFYSVLILVFEKYLERYLNTGVDYFDITIVVITFVALGQFLEAKSKLKTGEAIEKLIDLQAKKALIMDNDGEKEVDIDKVSPGNIIIIKPGSKIPVDGKVINGSSFVDESIITGEPMPVKKVPGDDVVAGTLNTNGTFSFRAEKVGAQTLLANIIRMVEAAQSSKAPIQALADKISSVFVPSVLVVSILVFLLWVSVGSYMLGFSVALPNALTALIGILVIACPCALGLATPTAIIVGVGMGAKEGILIKDAATLEKLHEVDTVVFDKTGTITKGKPEVIDIKNMSGDREDQLISILASLENKSEHPIASAIVEYAKLKNITILDVDFFEAIKGKGVKGKIGGLDYFAGNQKLISDLGVKFDDRIIKDWTLAGKTPIIISSRDKILGAVSVSDAIKLESKKAVNDLRNMGIELIMLTGDDRNTAGAISREIGIDQVIAEVLPEQKMEKVDLLQSKGHIVAMAGDGVNDAPALAKADVGIAMGTGTDVAIETAGITLLRGDISKLAKAIKLSKLTMRGIRQNLFWAFIYNLVGIPIAAGILYPFFGIMLSPIFAGLAMAFSSVSVVSNSLRLKRVKL